MSTPTTPVPTQTPPPPLALAMNLLDGLLLRDDLPLGARLDLTEVFADLLDVRPPFPPFPPFPPTVPAPTAATGTWTAVATQVEAALRQLSTDTRGGVQPAVVLGYALAARRVRDTVARHDPAAS